MLYDETDTRKQIRRPTQALAERARKNPHLAQKRIEQFISDLVEKNGDEVLIAALESVLADARLLVIEQGKRSQLEERLEVVLHYKDANINNSNAHHNEQRRIAKRRSTIENA